MNAALAAASAGSVRPWLPSGPLKADSGLRLLVGGPLRRQLRWSPDPDAPDARPLLDGEMRLAIRWIELSAQELLHRAPDAGLAHRPDPRPDAWRPIQAIGCAELVESRVQGLSAGQCLLGPLHLGTHRVLRLLSTDAAGCIAADPADERQVRQLRYGWIPLLPLRCGIAGPDAVEQAVLALRDRLDGGDHRVRLSLSARTGPAVLPAPQ